MDNEDKFKWKSGDVSITIPQCKSCVYYDGPQKCKIDVEVNLKILLNKTKCNYYSKN